MTSLITSLGNLSENVNVLFIPTKTIPNTVILANENFLTLLSLKSGRIVAILKKNLHIFQKITIIDVSKSVMSRIISIGAAFNTGAIQIWQLNLEKNSINCLVLKGHFTSIDTILFWYKERFFFSACNDGCLIFWNLNTKMGIFRIKRAHNAKIRSLDCVVNKNLFSQFVVSFGDDNLIKFWNIKSGLCSKIINTFSRRISGINFFDKNKMLLFTKNDNTVTIFCIRKTLDCKLIKKIQIANVSTKSRILTSKTESIFFMYGEGKFIEIFVFEKNRNNFIKKKKDKINFHKHNLDIKINYLVTKHINGIDAFKHIEGKTIYVLITYREHFIEIYKFCIRHKFKKQNHIFFQKVYQNKLECNQSDIREILWFGNDFFVASLCGKAKVLTVWFLNTQRCARVLPIESAGLCMTLSGKEQAIVGTKRGNIEIFDLVSGALLFSKPKAHIGPVWSVVTIQNFFQIATGGADGFLKFWEWNDGELTLSKYLEIGDQILGLEFIKNKKFIVINSLSSKLLFFLWNNLQFSFSFEGHSMPILTLSTESSESLLATGSADNYLRIWDLNTKQLKKSAKYNKSAITAVTFHKFTGHIFSGSRCGNICLWSQKKYDLLLEIENFHKSSVWALTFSNNGKFMASGSQDKKLNIWKIDELKMSNHILDKKTDVKHPDYNSNGNVTRRKKKNKKSNILNDFKLFVLDKKKARENIISTEFDIKLKPSAFIKKITLKEWIFLLETQKYESVCYFLESVFNELTSNNQQDFVGNVRKYIEFLQFAKKNHDMQNQSRISKLCKLVKRYVYNISEEMSAILTTFLLFKKLSSERFSDLPDSN